MTQLGPIGVADLKAFFDTEPAAAFVVEGIVKSADARYVGQVGLHDRDPAFRMGWWGTLSPTSRFHLLDFAEADVGFDGVAILFRQFDRSRFKDHPVDYLAGWVPTAMRPRAEAWVAELNAHIAQRLAAKG